MVESDTGCSSTTWVFLTFGFEFFQLGNQFLCSVLILLRLGLSICDVGLNIFELLGEGLLDFGQIVAHLVQTRVQILLLGQLNRVFALQTLQLHLVRLFQFLQLLVLIFDLLFLLLDELFLPGNGLLHLALFLVLLIFVRLHVCFQVLFDLLDVINFLLLLAQHFSGLFELAVLVPELVDLGLELVGLLLLDHLDVASGDFSDLGQAAVRESVPLKTDVDQCRVLVQCFKHDGFDLLAEEVVGELDLTDALVFLESLDEEDQASVVQSARTEIKSLQFRSTIAIALNHTGEDLQDLIAKEVFVAHKSL